MGYNGSGIAIHQGATGPRVENAIVRNNTSFGVLFASGAAGNVVSNTQIHGNGAMGIATAITPTDEIAGPINAPPAWITAVEKTDPLSVTVSGMAPANPTGPSLIGYRVELYRTAFEPS